MIDYSHPARRRLRAARRIGGAALRARPWTDAVVVPTYWWDGHPNFGDDLTPWLMPEYGVVPIHREPAGSRLAGVGSILEFLPEEFDGAIWGSGLMYERPHPLPLARALAVRGALTRELIGAPRNTAVGDPGLLVSRRVKRPPMKWSVGFVPHGHHRSHARFVGLVDPHAGHRIINVHQSARTAVREIGSCEVVVTTSLHGLVTADAFGIPAVWTTLDPPLNGGDFKFRDYESAVSPNRSRFVPFDDSMVPAHLIARASPVSADRVSVLCEGLESRLRDVLTEVEGTGRFPRGVFGISARRRRGE